MQISLCISPRLLVLFHSVSNYLNIDPSKNFERFLKKRSCFMYLKLCHVDHTYATHVEFAHNRDRVTQTSMSSGHVLVEIYS